MLKLDLEKAKESEIILPTSVGSQKKYDNSRKNIYFCFIDYTKAFYCVDHNKLWKIPQARIKIARRNINNLRYADDTTLMAEGEEELKSLSMKVKEESENRQVWSTILG